MFKKKNRNPLSNLGWLGWIGVIGMNTGDFLLQGFIIYFFFFLYSNMPTDELFWKNVQKAGFRSFILSVVGGSVVVILITIIERLGTTPNGINIITISGLLVYFVTLCFFILSLAYYYQQDKKYLEEQDV